jgi:hypothetical protein
MAFTVVESKRGLLDIHSITVTAGQTLKIETSPDGEEILVEVCPEGETWDVRIHIEINITD